MTETIPLDQGDPRWVFPALTEAEAPAVEAALALAAGRIRRIATGLGVRAGRTGAGLEYHRNEWIVAATVTGFVETPGLLVVCSLGFPRRCGFDLSWGPPWRAGTEVEVAGEVVDGWEEWFGQPVAAAEGFAAAADRLTGRVTAAVRRGHRA
ncbi:hypothetical protein [Kitasatospora sp. NPDC056181]|uniref:hypothetical protein n=1 Tax=Kitasatospora sp. NPDC056181 TaxID=3345737 RepID=UPI0035DC6CD0